MLQKKKRKLEIPSSGNLSDFFVVVKTILMNTDENLILKDVYNYRQVFLLHYY
jgi:hypothetical protein